MENIKINNKGKLKWVIILYFIITVINNIRLFLSIKIAMSIIINKNIKIILLILLIKILLFNIFFFRSSIMFLNIRRII